MSNKSIIRGKYVNDKKVKEYSAGDRVALIIGNANYQYSGRLANPKRDAKLLGKTLKEKGFHKVMVKTDLRREEMLSAFNKFMNELPEEIEWILIYFSGHGLQYKNQNYMIPIDANIKYEEDIELQSINYQTISSQLDQVGNFRLVILDACRSDPTLQNIQSRQGRTRAIGLANGLAPVDVDGINEYVVYATKHNDVASDGAWGDNSPFVKSMVSRINQSPPLEVGDLFRSVRDDVMKETNGKQQPYTYGSLGIEKFYFDYELS